MSVELGLLLFALGTLAGVGLTWACTRLCDRLNAHG